MSRRTKTGPAFQITWCVDSFDLRSNLAKSGIDAGEVVQRYGAEGDGPSVYINDPDGNTIELKGPAGG